MKLPIRIKFIGALVLASVLPLCVALVALLQFGTKNYRRSQGTVFQTRAQELANSLGLTVGEQAHLIADWAALSELPLRLSENISTEDEQTQAQIDALESRWAGLGKDAPELKAIVGHPIAELLREYQATHPLCAEILVTDMRGRLIAATDKTSDYWQADEAWWQQARQAHGTETHIEGIQFDSSAQVYSVDVSLPIRQRLRPDKPIVGILKAVINASPLLSQVAPITHDGAIHEVVHADGRVLVELDGRRIGPMEQRVTPEAIKQLNPRAPGTLWEKMGNGRVHLAGYAPLQLNRRNWMKEKAENVSAFVLVHRDQDEVLAPFRRNVMIMAALGAALVLVCAFAAYWYVGNNIIAPVESLRSATRAISDSAKFTDGEMPPRKLAALAPLEKISTNDELGDLSRDFASMASKVLTYHERLEQDLAAKTAEIERDLRIAREFQEALMPQSYPRLSSSDQGSVIGLGFNHIYQPASSVGGDFFDVLKLSEHRAGIFIADVMGHGARSALVTAILRALLQNLAFANGDPAEFLSALNTHFSEIVRDSQDTVFVTAFYLVIDTQTATALYASAGHPSPLLGNRQTREVDPLIGSLRGNPALGLFPHATYTTFTRHLKPGDLFLLFTDGLHEADNATGEEFGMERLRRVLASELERPLGELSQAVVDNLHAFMAPITPADDLCLVAVEVLPGSENLPANVSPMNAVKSLAGQAS